jgi:uncharacterized protein
MINQDHEIYSNAHIRAILQNTKVVAMVGASNNSVRPSFFVLKYLSERGYKIYPINPSLAGQQVLGMTFLSSLKDVPEQIDMVDVFRNSDAALEITREAIALNPKYIWLQLGVFNLEAANLAQNAGIAMIMNRCPKIELGRLSSEIGWMGVNTGVISSKRTTLLAENKVQRLNLRPVFGENNNSRKI